MSVLHLMIPRDEQPSVFVAKLDDFGVFHVSPGLTILVFKPLWEPLHGETRCSEAHSNRLGGKAFVEKEDAFLTPFFDVYQCASVLAERSCDQGHNQQQSHLPLLRRVCAPRVR